MLQQRSIAPIVVDSSESRHVATKLAPDLMKDFERWATERNLPNGALLRFLLTAIATSTSELQETLLHKVDQLAARARKQKRPRGKQRNVVWG